MELQIDQNERLEEVKNSLSRFEQTLAEVRDNKVSGLIRSSKYELLDQLLRQFSIADDLRSKLQRFMESLQFEARPRRHEAIPEAHKQTFRWLLDDQNTEDGTLDIPSKDETQRRTTFAQWLKSGNGIFWVSGKPGSGKSTFMKFVAGAARTHQLVSFWAYPTIIVAHYFWSSGSSIQKSREGLLRSLLYDIFRQCPELIPIVCQERWQQLDNLKFPNGGWSLPSLIEALRKITEEETQKRINILFFIDGMDELEGNHDEQFELVCLISLLARLILTPRVGQMLTLVYFGTVSNDECSGSIPTCQDLHFKQAMERI